MGVHHLMKQNELFLLVKKSMIFSSSTAVVQLLTICICLDQYYRKHNNFIVPVTYKTPHVMMSSIAKTWQPFFPNHKIAHIFPLCHPLLWPTSQLCCLQDNHCHLTASQLTTTNKTGISSLHRQKEEKRTSIAPHLPNTATCMNIQGTIWLKKLWLT